MNRITFGKPYGERTESTIDVFLNGEPVGYLTRENPMTRQPGGKRPTFRRVVVTLWDLGTDAVFSAPEYDAFAAPEYDAAGALRAAKAWVKAVLA